MENPQLHRQLLVLQKNTHEEGGYVMALNNKFVNVALENMPKHMGIRKEVLVTGGDKHDGFRRSFYLKTKPIDQEYTNSAKSTKKKPTKREI